MASREVPRPSPELSTEYSSRVDKGYLAFLEETTRATSLRAACKTETITPEGGTIDLFGHELIFPPGAVLVDTDVEISIDNNPDNFPKSLVPVSLIVGCTPSQFRKPVKVKLDSWLKPREGRKVKSIIYSKASPEMEWVAYREVTLSRWGIIQYEVLNLSKCTAMISNEDISNGSILFFNDLLMHAECGYIVSLLFRDKKSRKDLLNELRPVLTSVVSLPQEPEIDIGGTIHMRIRCKKPSTMRMIPDHQGLVTITKKHALSNKVECWFVPEPLPAVINHPDLFDLTYSVNVYNAQGTLDDEESFDIPLNYSWPAES